MRVIWDENKNEINIAKHGVSFETASLVFVDEFRIELYDAEHSTEGEDRWQIKCIQQTICQNLIWQKLKELKICLILKLTLPIFQN